jgi:hypothetical protein
MQVVFKRLQIEGSKTFVHEGKGIVHPSVFSVQHWHDLSDIIIIVICSTILHLWWYLNYLFIIKIKAYLSSNPFKRGVLNTILCDKVCQWLAAGRWFSPVSSTNKTDCHNITEIVLKVALNTINLNLIFNFSWFWLSCFRLFILVTSKDFELFACQIFWLSIPDEGYSRNVSSTLNEMPTFLFLKHIFVLYFPVFASM